MEPLARRHKTVEGDIFWLKRSGRNYVEELGIPCPSKEERDSLATVSDY